MKDHVIMYLILGFVTLAILTHAAGFTADTLGVGNVVTNVGGALSGKGNKAGSTGSFTFGTTSFSLT